MAGMIRNAYTAVIARGEQWVAQVFTEPYEAAWASEAVFFVHVMEAVGICGAATVARVQISPDGIRWIDEGASMEIPTRADALAFARTVNFGGWLRLAVDVPAGEAITVVATLALKG